MLFAEKAESTKLLQVLALLTYSRDFIRSLVILVVLLKSHYTMENIRESSIL